jgi:hypothetical protein
MESALEYDPLEAPEPEEWLAIDEAERIQLAQDYHRRARVRLPNEKLHAVFHVVVENQIALGDEMPVQSNSASWLRASIDMRPSMPSLLCSPSSCMIL